MDNNNLVYATQLMTDLAMVFSLGRAASVSSADISSEGDAEAIANSRALADKCWEWPQTVQTH